MKHPQCDHINRVAVHSSIKIGGVSIGQCEKKCLPLMVVCAEHATPDAIRMAMRSLLRERDAALDEPPFQKPPDDQETET